MDFKLIIIYSKSYLKKIILNANLHDIRDELSLTSILLSHRQKERKYEPMHHSLCPMAFASAYRKEEINIRIKRETRYLYRNKESYLSIGTYTSHTHTLILEHGLIFWNLIFEFSYFCLINFIEVTFND